MNTITPEYKIIEDLPSLYCVTATVIADTEEALRRGIARYLVRHSPQGYTINVGQTKKLEDGKLTCHIVRSATCD